MTGMDPAAFYTGIVAELYGPLKSATQRAEPYARFIAETGAPALELGCGDGEPLLELSSQGYAVEGVDSSADMLTRCRQRAAAEGIPVVLHQQRMEALDLPRRYRSIFLAGPTFNLLPDDDTARRALRGIRDHLEPDGMALVPLFVPQPTPASEFGQVRTRTASDGAELRVSVVAEERDEQERVQRTTLRYERDRNGASAVVERPWVLHWYTPERFRDLASEAGLTEVPLPDYLESEFAATPTEFAFLLR